MIKTVMQTTNPTSGKYNNKIICVKKYISVTFVSCWIDIETHALFLKKHTHIQKP